YREVALMRYADRCTEIRLTPLSEPDAERLVDALVDTGEYAELRALILEKAEGNPLFIEEIVRALHEQGALEQGEGPPRRFRRAPGLDLWDVTIPSSVQALLLQRIDRFAPEPRRVLLQAAVIGRTFSLTTLEAIVEDARQVREAIATLERHGLIHEA